MNNGSWIPVSSDKFPPVEELVQVTYRYVAGCDRYGCCGLAYISGDSKDSTQWKWAYRPSQDEAEIVAWRYCNDPYDPGAKSRAVGRYNTAVRNCMSDEYVQTSKKRSELMHQLIDVNEKLTDKNMPYIEYIDLEKLAASLGAEIEKVTVELDTWDKAREICLSAADSEVY